MDAAQEFPVILALTDTFSAVNGTEAEDRIILKKRFPESV